MIYAAVSHISKQLNQFFKRSFDLSEDVVVLSNMMDLGASLAPNIDNKLLVFLVNIEKETVSQRQANPGSSERSASSYPPVFLNMYVMIAANFSGSNYPEALKFISNTVSYFQRQPVFDHQQSPELDKRINKLTLDIENLNIQDLSSLWGVLSGKYLPSVLYKVRMVSFDSGDITSHVTPVKGHESSLA